MRRYQDPLSGIAMKRQPTHQDVRRHSTLVGVYCGFVAAAIACLIAILALAAGLGLGGWLL